MHCPVCRHEDTKVVDSRLSSDGLSVRRRRECEHCDHRFSTLEEVELLDLTVVKNDGRREAYSRDKIIKGLERALEKRPYTEVELKSLLHRIECDIQKKKRGEIKSSEIGETVIKHLKTFDKVAYIRFASVYRAFGDLKKFEEELKSLIRFPNRKQNNKKKKK